MNAGRPARPAHTADVSLIPLLLQTLCTDLSELGCALSSSVRAVHRDSTDGFAARMRMGLAFSVVGLSMLIGTPIFGALLAPAPASASIKALGLEKNDMACVENEPVSI